MLVFQGPGSRKLKIKYFGPTSDQTLHILGEQGLQQVRVVSQHTHLGCVIHHQPDNRKEARRRIGIAQQAFSQHRRSLLQNPVLSVGRRLELFKTLIMSKLCYGTETWIFTDQRTKTYIHNAIMRLLRRLLRGPHDAHWSDEDILTELGTHSPTEWLRLSRLRYLGTLHNCRDLVPWGLLNQDLQWTTLLADDLSWLWDQLRCSSSLPDPQVSLSAWRDLWCHHPTYWRRLVRRGGEHAILQRGRAHRVTGFHRRFACIFEPLHHGHFSAPLHGVPDTAWQDADGSIHACMQCGQLFA